MPEPPKVIIVGAGPAGLILAILLAQAQIPSLVLEAWPHVDGRLRATQYGVPATRIFKRAGLLPDIRAGSIPSFPSICWRRGRDHEKLAQIDMSCVADHDDRMTIMPLGDLCKVMLRHCREIWCEWVEVRFGWRVINVGQDGESEGEGRSQGAWVDVEVSEGESHGTTKRSVRLYAEWVVGCDGGSSTVRKALFGRNFPGQTFDQQVVVQNVWYKGFGEHGWTGGNYIVDSDVWGLIAKRGKCSLWRVTYGDVGGLIEEEYLARRPARLAKMLPGHPNPGQYELGDTNIYKMHNRCAESFRKGRVLLAADAAHICNPWGGYGCMTAVIDAGGLADCLIGLFKGFAGEEILDKYSEIRREKFLRYVDARSIKNLNRVSQSDPETVGETDPFLGILKGLEGDPEATRAFLLKTSSIEYDFTQHYLEDTASNGASTGSIHPENEHKD